MFCWDASGTCYRNRRSRYPAANASLLGPIPTPGRIRNGPLILNILPIPVSPHEHTTTASGPVRNRARSHCGQLLRNRRRLKLLS